MNTFSKLRRSHYVVRYCLLFPMAFLVQSIQAQSPYRYDVIATSSSSLQVFAAPSINNNGDVVFAGRKNPGGGSIFKDNLPNDPKDLMTIFSNQSFWSASGQLQINDSRQILSLWTNNSASPTQNWLRVIDGRTVNASTIVAAANGAGGFNDFDEIYPSGLTYGNGAIPIFQTRLGSSTSILTNGVRPNFTSRTFVPSFGPGLRPMISDINTAVLRFGNGGNSPIVILDEARLDDQSIPPLDIATTVDGFSQFGQSPSISKNDEAIAFYADLDQNGANTLGTNPGPGIFVSIKLDNGQRKTIRLAGRLVENVSAPGGNDDGVCDPTETCVPGELGFDLAGNPIFFNLFDANSRMDVAYIASGKAGIEDDLVMISFVATPNIASDAPGRIFSNQTGLWTLTAKIALEAGLVREKPEKAIPVAQVGDVINAKTLTGIQVYDQISNNVERVAFWASSNTGNMILRAVRDPGVPVIFVPGIAGSELRRPSPNDERLWFPEYLSNDITPLAIANDVRATDAMRKFKVGVISGDEIEMEIYQSLLNSFRDGGYVEYDLDGDVNRLDATCGGQILAELQAKHPTLFVFPYDWRKSNGDSGVDGNITKLKNYIACVRRIYPNTQVNIVAHSMGGLLSRSYILQNPNAHYVNNLVTIGSPWLGAPKAIYAMETGSFLSDAFPNNLSGRATYWLPDALFAPQMKQIVEGFRGAHELLPSLKYFQLGGHPLRIDGTDLGYIQVRDWIDDRHPTYDPGTNSEAFHTAAQDDFTNDSTGVNYYHLYGRQPRDLTVGRIEPRNKYVRYLLPTVIKERVYLDFDPIAVAGDGTVPIISSSRRIDSSAGLNATCGTPNDARCIGVCYSDADDPKGALSQHNGLTSNTQVQAQVLQILQYANGLRSTNPSFETTSCHLPPNGLNPTGTAESHYLTTTGIKSLLITDAQGNNNGAVSTAYKKLVPGVSESIIGSDSMQVITRIDNTYTLRFTGNGEPVAVEDIRGPSNELAEATYIVRYDDVLVESGVVAEVKIVNDQVDSLKVDSNGDGTPDTVIPPSRVITDPQNDDLMPPQISVIWNKPFHPTRASVVLTDTGSGPERSFYRICYSGQCSGSFQEVIYAGKYSVLFSAFASGIEVVSEDNAGNRSDVTFVDRP